MRFEKTALCAAALIGSVLKIRFDKRKPKIKIPTLPQQTATRVGHPLLNLAERLHSCRFIVFYIEDGVQLGDL